MTLRMSCARPLASSGSPATPVSPFDCKNGSQLEFDMFECVVSGVSLSFLMSTLEDLFVSAIGENNVELRRRTRSRLVVDIACCCAVALVAVVLCSVRMRASSGVERRVVVVVAVVFPRGATVVATTASVSQTSTTGSFCEACIFPVCVCVFLVDLSNCSIYFVVVVVVGRNEMKWKSIKRVCVFRSRRFIYLLVKQLHVQFRFVKQETSCPAGLYLSLLCA